MASLIVAPIGSKENPYKDIPPVKDRESTKWYLYKGVSTQFKDRHWITPQYIENRRKRNKKYRKKKREEKLKYKNTQEYKNLEIKRKVFSRLKEIRRSNKYYRRPEWKKHKQEYDKKRRAKEGYKEEKKKIDAEYYQKVYKERLLCIHCDEVLATKKHFRKHCRNCFSLLFPNEFIKIVKKFNGNQTEIKTLNWLKERFPSLLEISKEWSPNWFEKKLRFDITIHNFKLIIEIDGPQHFSFNNRIKNVFNKKMTTEERIERDIHKMKKANENGYSVIRIIQEDIWFDKNNWENNLFAAIKSYDTPTNIFICSNNEYEDHKRLL